jgi:hypothetical protein
MSHVNGKMTRFFVFFYILAHCAKCIPGKNIPILALCRAWREDSKNIKTGTVSLPVRPQSPFKDGKCLGKLTKNIKNYDFAGL